LKQLEPEIVALELDVGAPGAEVDSVAPDGIDLDADAVDGVSDDPDPEVRLRVGSEEALRFDLVEQQVSVPGGILARRRDGDSHWGSSSGYHDQARRDRFSAVRTLGTSTMDNS
jgi:hypothetical protein